MTEAHLKTPESSRNEQSASWIAVISLDGVTLDGSDDVNFLS
jgi:hypothetical protein